MKTNIEYPEFKWIDHEDKWEKYCKREKEFIVNGGKYR